MMVGTDCSLLHAASEDDASAFVGLYHGVVLANHYVVSAWHFGANRVTHPSRREEPKLAPKPQPTRPAFRSNCASMTDTYVLSKAATAGVPKAGFPFENHWPLRNRIRRT
jgi:hypothetical protein